MARLEDLDQFKDIINNLSDELSWRDEHGEDLENISPPSENLNRLRGADWENQDLPDNTAPDNFSLTLNDELPELDDELPNFDDELPNFDDELPELDDELPKLDDELPKLDDELPELDDELPKLDDELPELDDELPKLDDELPELDDELPDFDDELPELDDELPKLDDELPDFDDELPDFDDELPELDDELPKLDDELPELDDELPKLSGSFMGGISDLDDTENIDTEFNIGDFGDTFAEKKVVTLKPDEVEPSVDDIPLTFTNMQLQQIKAHLARMPRNLKIALEEILADDETSLHTLKSITEKLLWHDRARSLADEVRKATGITITVPSFYEKTTGREFEKRRHSFAYIFKAFYWPKLRRFIALGVVAWSIFLLSFNFIYRPIQAYLYYQAGEKTIALLDYNSSIRLFNTAFLGWSINFGTINIDVKGWPEEKWFYRYADSYAKNKQFSLAEEKYKELLVHYPDSKKAFLHYGSFENSRTFYEEADAIYDLYLNTINKQNLAIIMAKGDNLMDWGDIDEGKYREANRSYSDLQRIYGENPALSLRFLNYALKTNHATMIEFYGNYYISSPKLKGDAEIFADLGSWYMDHQRENDAFIILKRALAANFESPSVHYQLARYYDHLGDLASQQSSLNLARAYLDQLEPFNRKQIETSIDIYRRMALMDSKKGDFSKAELFFIQAVKAYESALERKVLASTAKYGKLYKQLANLYLTQGSDPRAAAFYYDKALEHHFDDAELRYYRGYIAYNNELYSDALLNFHLAYENEPYNYNVLFSLATVLAKRENLASSQAFYFKLIQLLEEERTSYLTSPFSSINVDTLMLSTFLMRSYNNIAVVYYYLNQGSDHTTNYLQRSYLSFEESARSWDYLTRNYQSKIRSSETGLAINNLAFTNGNITRQDKLLIYDQLPNKFDEELSDWG